MLFSKGRTDDKLRIIFDMCDNDKNGQIDKTELSELLNSLVVIAKTQKLSDKSVNDLIDSMFLSAGFKVSHATYAFLVLICVKLVTKPMPTFSYVCCLSQNLFF